jgi:N-acylglucosamine-6-phosphate 2-epimerase
MNISILDSLKGGIIVSCQAEGADPFNCPDYVVLFAKAAQMGGAIGIRSEGLDKIKAIKAEINLPMIGLIKDSFDDGFVRITGSFKSVENLIRIGCDIVAIDGTFRKREGLSGPDFIRKIKQRYDNIVVLADIATYEEAIASEEAGADCVSTALSGYTRETQGNRNSPDFELIKYLSRKISIPIFAEGRINTPKDAKQSMDFGAYAVVVGTAITRPRVITSWFVNETIKDKKIKK